ncbi:hypothetical protein FOQG_07363 [Fusarium oxysporum f. sp. raphani 54005]|uniref:Uncharacterized protein n=3 Tax=Fusarium oxysporum TaxID=5507 RepID=X0CF67_FUSOX|nr:hypothetical protein FOVG_01201 [Fusarium oxysporum f. sp. pisi HDV247]EXK89878.1 hypothetical protein FOQG_07363 [Fusarium oxysporum f. sp. raphani 54005]EXL83526.1 hypothetical protein FOPG_03673 [Fusarium oxysporum f. sp. conglutinans race 2 54008]
MGSQRKTKLNCLTSSALIREKRSAKWRFQSG